MTDPQQAKILIADDEPLYLRTTGELLRRAGYECICVPDADAALAALSSERFDLVLSDLNMPGNANLELLRQGRHDWPQVPLIVVTGVPSLPTAIESIRLGIADYLLKPVKYDDLLASVRRALAQRSDNPPKQDRSSDERRKLADKFPEIIGQSPKMLELFDVVDRVAETDTNILLTGESGVGKEVVARAIHRASPRSKHSFQVIDCTAVPESLFESVLFGHVKGSFTGAVKDQAGLLNRSHRGTAFFDEIGELPATSQAKLLRVIQERTFMPVGQNTPVEVDTRIVCATNRDLEMEVATGSFRRDLFYRLAVIHIELPPLRDRGDDVLLLAHHFIDELAGRQNPNDLSPNVAERFLNYAWPGNIRELRNVLERALALSRSSTIELDDLPQSLQAEPTRKPTAAGDRPQQSREEALDDAERAYLTTLLEQHRGNVSQAAQQAGVSRQGLHKLLQKHSLAAAEFRR